MLSVFRKVKFRPAISHRKCTNKQNHPNYDNNNNNDNEPKSRTIYGQEYKPWRRPWIELPGEVQPKLAMFSLAETSNVTLKRIMNNPEPMKWLQDFEDYKVKLDQDYVPERCAVLGPDLALAHFVLFRGGKVKFKNSDEWITEYKKDGEYTVPSTYVSDMILEAVDCKNFKDGLRYDGLDNFSDLVGLRYISFNGEPYIDDWCLDKISNLVRFSLECIDVCGTKITHLGLVALAKMNYLNMIIMDEKQYKTGDMELTCAQFEHDRPGLLIKVVPKEVKSEKT